MEIGNLQFPKINIEPFQYVPDYHARIFVQYVSIVEKTDFGQSLLDTFLQDTRITALEGKMLSRGNGSSLFSAKTLLMWFIWCANERGYDIAQESLEIFLNSDTIPVMNTLWVLGIEVDEPIDLGSGYTIQPVKGMPDSQDKEAFLQFPLSHHSHRYPVPAAAITKTCNIQKIWDSSKRRLEERDQEFWSVHHYLYEIALLINVLNGISCLPFYSTCYMEQTTPIGPFAGAGGSGPLYDVLAQGSVKLSDTAGIEIKGLLAKYESLTPSEKKRFQLILSRLSQSKRRTQLEDKILDLGIVLEMLLLDDNKNHDQLSLSFRLRGSWLIGESVADRKRIYNHLKNIYTYRSQVAHSGVLCEGKDSKIQAVQEMFPEYQSIAEAICKKIIMQGKPNWDTLLLGSTSADKSLETKD